MTLITFFLSQVGLEPHFMFAGVFLALYLGQGEVYPDNLEGKAEMKSLLWETAD